MKSKLLVLFVFLLFLFGIFSGAKAEEQNSATQEIVADVSHIEMSKFQFQDEGELPASQLFSPVFPKTSNQFSSSEKTKKIVRNLFHSEQDTRYKFSYSQALVFGWQSSAIRHIFLKTSCFRI